MNVWLMIKVNFQVKKLYEKTCREAVSSLVDEKSRRLEGR